MDNNPVNEQNYSREQIRKDMRVRKQKQKKKKEIREEFILVSGRRKKKKPPSDVVIAVNELLKKGYDTKDKINAYFLGKDKKLSENAKRMYYALVNSKVFADSVKLTDNITNKPLHCFYVINGDNAYETTTISNDVLWLNLLSKKSYERTQHAELYNISTISSVWFGSDVFRYDNESIKKGYYQDYSEDFAMIGANGKSYEEKKALLNKQKYNFVYKDVNYTACGDSDMCIIYSENVKDNLDQLIRGTLEISSSGSTFIMNEKENKLKDRIFKYVDCKVKPESFCPAFLIMPKKQKYNVTIKMDIDYNKFFKYMENKTKYGTAAVYDYLVYWDTLDSYFEFIAIFIVTTKQKAAVERLKNAYNLYNELKPMIELWKTNQIRLQKIMYAFYHSFTGRINYDKLKSLDDNLTSYIEGKNRLVKDGSYKKIVEFFNVLENDYMIRNQFSEEIMSIADNMHNALVNLITGGENIIRDLRIVGGKIYQACLSSMNEPGSKVAFPFSVSTGLFLGDVWSEEGDKEGILAEQIEDYNQRMARREERREEEEKEIAEVMEKVNDRFPAVVEYSIERAEQSVGDYQLTPEESNECKLTIMGQINMDKEYRKKLNKEIAKLIRENNDNNGDIILPEKYMKMIKTYVNKRKLAKEKKELEARQNVNDAQNNLNDANMELDNVQIDIKTEPEKTVVQESLKKPVFVVSRDKPLFSTTVVDRPNFPNYQTPIAEMLANINDGPAGLVVGSAPARYYADLIYLSGNYPKFDRKSVVSNSLRSFMNMYKLNGNFIDALAIYYGLGRDILNYNSSSAKNPEFKMTGEIASKVLGQYEESRSKASTTV